MKLSSACSLLLLAAAELGAALRLASTPIGLRRRQLEQERREALVKRDTNPSLLYPAHFLAVPIDHFQNDSRYEPHTTATFNLRYYFDASHYKAGGPIIILEGGETSAVDRLPYLQKGILAQLAEATNGIGVVLEHRYYGNSIPTQNLTNESLRFLTTEQALADVAYFAQNIVFPGFEDVDLTAPTNPFFVYGGSYAGGMSAFLRVTYPDVFWGTIASSGVVFALWDYWQYWSPIVQFGPPTCISNTQKLIKVVDTILDTGDATKIATLKNAFGLGNLTFNDDFGNILASGVNWWQDRNWDHTPGVGFPDFHLYCANVSSNSVLFPETESLRSTAESLIEQGGCAAEKDELVNPLLNFIGWINLTEVSQCVGATQDECFSNHNPAPWEDKDASNWGLLSWTWQYCNEWGYLQTGSGTPANELSLVSRHITLDYMMLSCNLPFNITGPPDVERVNKYGGFNIQYPRLAFIGGEADPWRPVTTQADSARKRPSTTDEPFELIPGAVHHWDENGLFPNQTTPTLPPSQIVQVQTSEQDFVQAWLQEWQAQAELNAAKAKMMSEFNA